jgi:hypothetical protein
MRLKTVYEEEICCIGIQYIYKVIPIIHPYIILFYPVQHTYIHPAHFSPSEFPSLSQGMLMFVKPSPPPPNQELPKAQAMPKVKYRNETTVKCTREAGGMVHRDAKTRRICTFAP